MAVDRLENSCSMNSSITPNYSMFVLGIGIMVELGTEIRYMIIGLFFLGNSYWKMSGPLP